MYGHAYGPSKPQRPSDGVLIALRVLFVLLAMFTCGILAWAPLLRLAILTRKTRDWIAMAVSMVVGIGSLIMLGAEPTEEVDTAQEWIGTFGVLLTMVGVTVYYLTMEIRHFQQPTGYPGYPQPQQQPHPGPAYGYPQAPQQQMPQQQMQQMTQSQLPQQMPPTPRHIPNPAPAPAPTPPPGPARIDQVRAELDELSSFLRKQEPQDRPPQDHRPEGDR
ncbi:hypothetical protein [Streptomyces sp. NBC_01304]|uniref:hypothetical protein n=1 Tax=Streptomyces sp. NBC_01304 TaxID=2903818 RepID=UPI002E135966|nr:hypothetical protein OG430_28965 [Streptomyces sp. NBC_01304]